MHVIVAVEKTLGVSGRPLLRLIDATTVQSFIVFFLNRVCMFLYYFLSDFYNWLLRA